MLQAIADASTFLIGIFIIAVALALTVVSLRTRSKTRSELVMRLIYLAVGAYSAVVYTGRSMGVIDMALGTVLLRPLILILFFLVLGFALAQERINRKGG